MDSPEHEARAVREYLALELDETAGHVEKLAEHQVGPQRYAVWTVMAATGSWWVIDNPTSAYSQSEFKSADKALSYHIGLAVRVDARIRPPAGQAEQDRYAEPWRRWVQAVEALQAAREVEDIQAVGMRCRECLLAFVRVTRKEVALNPDTLQPKGADFVAWSDLLAGALATGPSAKVLRSYLKSAAKQTWQYVNWLTHASSAANRDGWIATKSTAHVLETFGVLLSDWRDDSLGRCPECQSSRLTVDFRPEGRYYDNPSVVLCEACGWEERPDDQEPKLIPPVV